MPANSWIKQQKTTAPQLCLIHLPSSQQQTRKNSGSVKQRNKKIEISIPQKKTNKSVATLPNFKL